MEVCIKLNTTVSLTYPLPSSLCLSFLHSVPLSLCPSSLLPSLPFLPVLLFNWSLVTKAAFTRQTVQLYNVFPFVVCLEAMSGSTSVNLVLLSQRTLSLRFRAEAGSLVNLIR